MSKNGLNPIPSRDPVTGRTCIVTKGPWIVTELTCEESGATLRDRFEIPRYSRLDSEQAKFLEVFLKCRGMLASVEKELGLSYPTVRSRLDSLLEALDLTPVKEDGQRRERLADAKKRILTQLEKGEIGPEEAKRKLKEGAAR